MRIAAVGDLHYDGKTPGRIPDLVSRVPDEADVLCLLGDLTTHGEPQQIRRLLELMKPLDLPVLTVLGNHEFECGRTGEVTELLEEHDVRVLDGDAVELDGVGFTGVKGFAGGFGTAALGGFGEPMIKRFVQEAMDEAMKLENGLRKLGTPVKVALLHYAPIAGTIAGEPDVIQAFLGSSRLSPPLDQFRPDVVFHGHAHTGSFRGTTPGGVPVYNVSFPVLERDDRLFFVWEAERPEASGEGGGEEGATTGL